MSELVTQEPRQLAPVDPMQLIANAIEKGVDINQLTKLMDLQERWEANNARKAFDEALTAAKAEIKPIAKKREVDFTSAKGRTNYMYEDLALIAEEVDPILSKYGLSYRYRAAQEGAKVSVTCVVAHRGGHSESTTLAASNDESGNKNSIQAVGSAVTYLQRYTLKLALGLAASKDVDGGTPREVISDEQYAKLDELIKASGADVKVLCKHFKIEKLSDLSVATYNDAESLLLARLKKVQK